METKLLKRIYAKVDTDEETLCFLYTGETNNKRYGRMHAHGKKQSVHRVMYEIFFGTIPANREVHHRCNVKNCCNPAHLELIIHRENVAKAVLYEQLRRERLWLLLDRYPELTLSPHIVLSSTALAALWDMRSDNVPEYLDTVALLYDGLFRWDVVDDKRGPKPFIFRLIIEPELIAQLEADDIDQDVLTHQPALAVTS